MSLKQQIISDMTAAMKAQDAAVVHQGVELPVRVPDVNASTGDGGGSVARDNRAVRAFVRAT